MMGTPVKSPLISLIDSKMTLSSSKLCLLMMEKTRMKAWPLLMLSLCMAGNWCEPVVSVICSVQMLLFEEITC